ncbi:restriction endonuclease subunit S [Polaromonas sp.]|uniref:restriction endonuclease subunit S n=1 Tax=Polaromonas sp. TaxID=1869339 RepID=UPI003267AB95
MLLSNLNLLATAPDGVAKLRELILTLAVQGKLVPQDPSEEPASELLKKIRTEKDRLIAERKIRRLKPLDPIDESETGFALPSTWEWERLGNLGDWGAGATPSRSNSSYYGGDIPWFKSGELNADFLSESEETVTDAALRDCSLRLNQVGDVLIAMYGATIGKTAILSVIATTNQAVCACTPFAGLSNTYLLLLMKALKPYFISIGAGGAQPNISREKVIATVIGFPPLAEQSRIVTRVEELMRLCDALEAKARLEATQHEQLVRTLLSTLPTSSTPEELTDHWHRVATHFDLLLDRPEAVDTLEQTILQLAVRGLLVPQDPQDEPASTLLQKIRAEKDRLIAEGKIKRDKPLPPIAEDEKPFELPQGWEWVKLGEIVVISSGVTLGRKTAIPSPISLPYLRVANVQRWHLNLASMKDVVIDSSELERFQLVHGDLLITEGGDWDKVGRTAIWRDEIPSCGHQNHIFKARGTSSQWNPVWAEMYLNSAVARAYFASSAKQTTNLASINMTQLKDCAFPMPPLAEQSRIVARVASLRALCADLRQRLTAARTQQALLAEVLIGEAA